MATSVLLSPADSTHEPSGADIWNAIVQAAITTFRTRPFHEVSLGVVAEECGLRLETVQERFPTQEDLLVATVQVWNAERMARIVPLAERNGAVAFLRALMEADVEDPSLGRLMTAVVNIAATPEHPMAPALQRQWIQFHALVVRSLARDVALGREMDGLDPARAADGLIALFEGLKLQSMMRPGLDLLDAWDHAIAGVQSGFASPTHVWRI